MQQPAGHAFISYVREDSHHVDALQLALEAGGVRVWRDKNDLRPGDDWRMVIRQAITDNALVFIACFSSHSAARATSYQYEELVLAIEQFRLRPPDAKWRRQPDRYRPDLAQSLNTLAAILSGLGRGAEAEEIRNEAKRFTSGS